MDNAIKSLFYDQKHGQTHTVHVISKAKLENIINMQ